MLQRLLIAEQNMADWDMAEEGFVTMPITIKAATLMVTIGPIFLLYPFLQRYFVKGIFIGSLKG